VRRQQARHTLRIPFRRRFEAPASSQRMASLVMQLAPRRLSIRKLARRRRFSSVQETAQDA
jgi:hypothetical protein